MFLVYIYVDICIHIYIGFVKVFDLSVYLYYIVQSVNKYAHVYIYIHMFMYLHVSFFSCGDEQWRCWGGHGRFSGVSAGFKASSAKFRGFRESRA